MKPIVHLGCEGFGLGGKFSILHLVMASARLQGRLESSAGTPSNPKTGGKEDGSSGSNIESGWL